MESRERASGTAKPSTEAEEGPLLANEESKEGTKPSGAAVAAGTIAPRRTNDTTSQEDEVATRMMVGDAGGGGDTRRPGVTVKSTTSTTTATTTATSEVVLAAAATVMIEDNGNVDASDHETAERTEPPPPEQSSDGFAREDEGTTAVAAGSNTDPAMIGNSSDCKRREVEPEAWSKGRKEGAGAEAEAFAGVNDGNGGGGGGNESGTRAEEPGDHVRLLVGSFNVGNSPLADLAPWLPYGGKGFDLIVVGLQESTYKAPRGARDSPLSHSNSVSPAITPVSRTVSGTSLSGRGSLSPRWPVTQTQASDMGDDTPPPGRGFSPFPSVSPLSIAERERQTIMLDSLSPIPRRSAAAPAPRKRYSSPLAQPSSVPSTPSSPTTSPAAHRRQQSSSPGNATKLGKPAASPLLARGSPPSSAAAAATVAAQQRQSPVGVSPKFTFNQGKPRISSPLAGWSSPLAAGSTVAVPTAAARQQPPPLPQPHPRGRSGQSGMMDLRQPSASSSSRTNSNSGRGAGASRTRSFTGRLESTPERKPLTTSGKLSPRTMKRRDSAPAAAGSSDSGPADGVDSAAAATRTTTTAMATTEENQAARKGKGVDREGDDGGDVDDSAFSSVTASGKRALLNRSPETSVERTIPRTPISFPARSPPAGGVRTSTSPLSAVVTTGTPAPRDPVIGLSQSLPSQLPEEQTSWELRSVADFSGHSLPLDWGSASGSVRTLDKDLTRFGRARKAVKKRTKELDAGAAHLRSMLHGHLGPDFEQVISLRRMQMRVKVFLRRSLLAVYDHEEGESTSENTGIGKVVANKGGLVCKLRLKGTTLCFVSCHLQAHEGQNHLARRNASCAEILQGARLGDRRNVDVDCQFHHVFWFGDMNYRISFSDLQPEEQHAHVMSLVNDGQWPELWKGDELLRELEAGRVLAGFKTEPPDFAPTFKTFRGQERGYSAKRVPSYTDRILWKSLPGHAPNLDLLAFCSFPEITSSDHKPIHAAFSIKLTPEVKSPLSPDRKRGRHRTRIPYVLDVPRLTHQLSSARLEFEDLHAMDLKEITGGFFVAFSTDPKHLLGASGKSNKTDMKRRTKNPRWKNHTCPLAVADPTLLIHSHVSLLVWGRESGVGSKNELIGVANIALAEVMLNSYPYKKPQPQQCQLHQGPASVSRRRSISNFLLHARRRSLSPQSVQSVQSVPGSGVQGWGEAFRLPRMPTPVGGGDGGEASPASAVTPSASAVTTATGTTSNKAGERARAATTGGDSDDWKLDEDFLKVNRKHRNAVAAADGVDVSDSSIASGNCDCGSGAGSDRTTAGISREVRAAVKSPGGAAAPDAHSPAPAAAGGPDEQKREARNNSADGDSGVEKGEASGGPRGGSSVKSFGEASVCSGSGNRLDRANTSTSLVSPARPAEAMAAREQHLPRLNSVSWRFFRRAPSLSSDASSWGPSTGGGVAGSLSSEAQEGVGAETRGRNKGGTDDSKNRVPPPPPPPTTTTTTTQTRHETTDPHHGNHQDRQHSRRSAGGGGSCGQYDIVLKDGLEFDVPLVKHGLQRGRINGRCRLVTDRSSPLGSAKGGGGGSSIAEGDSSAGERGERRAGLRVIGSTRSFRGLMSASNGKKGKMKKGRRFFKKRRGKERTLDSDGGGDRGGLTRGVDELSGGVGMAAVGADGESTAIVAVTARAGEESDREKSKSDISSIRSSSGKRGLGRSPVEGECSCM